ncbi:MAG: Arginine transport system permease protein ArtQ [Alphaproteobacteria bacterium MarineAlpha5_Bin8]|nr:MAG: Arginine transport system permease protein ArtQ [Alphaproteobacteria bacterium MarineAlpha5_Bin7]PPR48297.1 MAG: Arginine transport system permease protein ArtQ [Alphaproteobacteria bacterium MarineAlpha5_Bin8]PPR53773.1 MAG: Arginine transport system permease protein ArtQ [Alphaproteobacteria bacterium MarineAlpha5_Bin6]
MKYLTIIFLVFFLTSCNSNYNWGWYVLNPSLENGYSNLQFLLSGLSITVLISIFSIFFSLILGFLISLLSLSNYKIFKWTNTIYIEIFRSIPLLVLLLWVYYGLPVLFGISFGPFIAGIISLSLSDSAFEAEIFRAGLQSVSKGQKDAGKSIGLNKFQEMRFIIFPQALRIILPAIGNQFVYVLKMSSLVSILGLADLTRKANELVVSVYRPLEIYSFLVLEYLILILIISFLVRKLEQKLKTNL